MKQAAILLLVVQTFFLSPVLNAQTVGMAPVAMPQVSAPLTVGAAMSQGGTPSLGLGSQSLGGAQLGMTPSMALPSPAVQPPSVAVSAQQSAPAASVVSQAAPSAVLPAVARAVSPAAAQAVAAAPAEGAPAAAVQAVNKILSALPAAKSAPAAASKGAPSAAPQAVEAPLASLKEAAQPSWHGISKEAAASALFDGQKGESKEWTFMVFLNGHNNLDRFGEVNIKQMEKVGSNDRVNIVVQWASLGKPTKRMLIQRSESGEVGSPVIEELPAVDMGSADQLYEFIRWTVEKFPAARYMVDIWDHGAGWHIANRGVSFPHDVSWDDQTGNHITTEQVGEVMAKVKKLIGRPIDVLGFDCCLMAMGEIMAQVAGSVRYFAASEQTEPGAGWPYEKVLKQWLESKTDDGAALLKALTDQYVKAYGSNVQFSGFDLTKFPAFIEALKPFVEALAKLDDAKFADARKAAQATQRYAYSDYGDFLDFVNKLANISGGLIAAPVLAAVSSAFLAMRVANDASSDLKAGSNGMSVWMPMSSYLWKQYGARYLGLIWNTLTDWGKFARRLSGASKDPAAGPQA